MAEKRSLAKSIGKGLAFVQDTLDTAVNWGFHKLRTTKLPESEEDYGTKKGVAKKATNRVLGFFGELGESFYSEYDKLKSKKAHKKKDHGTQS